MKRLVNCDISLLLQDELLRIFRDKLNIGASAILKNERHAPCRSDAGNGWRRKGKGGRRFGQRVEFTIDALPNGVDLQFRGLALRPFFQGDEEPGVGLSERCSGG